MPISRVAALLCVCISVTAIKEPGSGIDFPKKSKLGTLQSFGVRKKGPIKVYAVGMYQDSFKSKGFLLKMAMGVGAPTGVAQSTLLYNEFIVYDVAQIQQRYVLQVKFKYK